MLTIKYICMLIRQAWNLAKLHHAISILKKGDKAALAQLTQLRLDGFTGMPKIVFYMFIPFVVFADTIVWHELLNGTLSVFIIKRENGEFIKTLNNINVI